MTTTLFTTLVSTITTLLTWMLKISTKISTKQNNNNQQVSDQLVVDNIKEYKDKSWKSSSINMNSTIQELYSYMQKSDIVNIRIYVNESSNIRYISFIPK